MDYRTSVFISYAREDKEFVSKLRTELEKNKIECLGDWLLLPAVDYKKRLKELNLKANMLLFVISPDSIASAACTEELLLAVDHKKIVLPISHRDHVDDNLLDSALRSPQWIFLKDDKDFTNEFPKLLEALETDFELMEMHGKLLLDVEEWQKNGKSKRYLLTNQLNDAESWVRKVALQPNKLPQPTSSQIDYIEVSRRAKSRTSRITISVIGVFAIFFLGLAITAVSFYFNSEKNREKADNARKEAEAQEKEAKKNMIRFKVEEFNRNIRNGKIYMDAEEFCLAKEAFISADSTVKDSSCMAEKAIVENKLTLYANLEKATNKCTQ